MVKKIITNRNLRQIVYESVRNHIVSPDVSPGAKIDEEALANDLGVSKTPVREALSKLAHDGILEIIPNRGAYKVKLSRNDLLEIMIIRETLEGLCVRLAAKHVNHKTINNLKSILDDFENNFLESDISRYPEALKKFHTSLYSMSKSPRLIRIIQSIYDLTRLFRLQYFNNSERVKRSLRTHRELIDALERGDGELAEKTLKEAIQFAYESLMKTVSEP